MHKTFNLSILYVILSCTPLKYKIHLYCKNCVLNKSISNTCPALTFSNERTYICYYIGRFVYVNSLYAHRMLNFSKEVELTRFARICLNRFFMARRTTSVILLTSE